MSRALPRSGRLFWPIVSVLTLTDCATKRVVEAEIAEHASRDVMGNAVRLTLAYNPGAAFSARFGPHERWILIGLAIVVLALLLRLYHTSRLGRLHIVGLALVAGGALGNLLDRVRSPRGVVDFIDVGVGATRFWVFNVADVGVSLGAMVLAYTLWRRGQDLGGVPNA